jgi:hypothetical protein
MFKKESFDIKPFVVWQIFVMPAKAGIQKP